MQIARAVLAELISELDNTKILILLGARQVGKTSLMTELEKHLLKKKKRCRFYNLEIPVDSRFFAKDQVELYDELIDNVDYLFIDEFHYLENATKLFKAIYDDRNLKVKIIASGSSALEIHQHLKESLAGRKQQYIIRPLSFSELKQDDKSFDWYLNYGGYPGLVHESTPLKQLKYLDEILKTYIMKDIKALIKEENISSFNAMLYYLAENQGQVISVSSIANDYRLDNATVERYLEILSQTFILHRISSYSSNLSNELKKSKKYYFYDMGIRNSIINSFERIKTRKDKGSLYEQYVCNFLINNLTPNAELRFWRTRSGDEIDFVYLKNNKPYIFEVKSKLNKLEVPDSMKIFIRNYRNLQGAYLINENLEAQIDYNGVTVNFIKIEDLEEDLLIREVFEA